MSKDSQNGIKQAWKELFEGEKRLRIAGAGLKNAGDEKTAEIVEKIADNVKETRDNINKKLGKTSG